MFRVMQTQPDYVHVDNLAGQAEPPKRSLWEGCKAGVARTATFLGRIFLTIFYWLCVTPFALGVKLLADPLGLKKDSCGGAWQPVHTSDKAGAQF